MTDSDKKGLSGLISKFTIIYSASCDFVGDLFGDIFTSIPSTISAFNDCNSFWEDSKTYVYTPHQLSGYAGQAELAMKILMNPFKSSSRRLKSISVIRMCSAARRLKRRSTVPASSVMH